MQNLSVIQDAQVRDAMKQASLEQLWLDGQAHTALLDAGQIGWLERFISAPPISSTVWLIGRQRGKSFAAIYLAILYGITKKNAIIRFCAKTKDTAVGIVMPAWMAITETMPESIRPVKGRNEYEFKFPSTGAIFVIFGTDAQSFDKGRGPKTDLQLLDECGFYSDLENVEAALFPSVQTTGGKILYLSTPPRSLAHPYVDRVRSIEAAGRCEHGTFYENPRVNHEQIIKMEAERNGLPVEEYLKSTDFRREYLAELVQETTTAGFPSFNEEKSQRITQNIEIPTYYDGYVGADLGLNTDPHAAVFAIHDWKTDRLYVLDELSLPSATNSVGFFADALKTKERELWGIDQWSGTILGAKDWEEEFGSLPEYMQQMVRQQAPKNPYMRVVDNASGAAKEFSLSYQYGALPAQKTNLHMAVESLNSALASERILIHPRCVKLLRQLKTAQWNKQRTTWVRAEGHHYDLAQCLVYVWRHIVHSRIKLLPMPKNQDVFTIPEFAKPKAPPSNNVQALRGIFNGLRR